jgi:transcriptional regulator with XRE-family HTH domain
MTTNTVGSIIHKARKEARMSQRELAALVGVQATHIAYMESGARRPSITVINRLRETLGVDSKKLVLLAYPGLEQAIYGAGSHPAKRNEAWKCFVSNRGLQKRYSISSGEFKVLKQIAMLEQVAHPSYFIFILNSIRQAAAPEL